MIHASRRMLDVDHRVYLLSYMGAVWCLYMAAFFCGAANLRRKGGTGGGVSALEVVGETFQIFAAN